MIMTSSTIGKPTILVLSPEPLFDAPPGVHSAAIFRIFNELAADYHVVILSQNRISRSEALIHRDNLRQVRVGWGSQLDAAVETLSRAGIMGNLDGLALAMSLAGTDDPYREMALELAKSASLIAHLSPFTQNIPFENEIPEIYLPQQFLLDERNQPIAGPSAEKAWRKILSLEQRICKRAKAIISADFDLLKKYQILFGIADARILRLVIGRPINSTHEQSDCILHWFQRRQEKTQNNYPQDNFPVTIAINDYDILGAASGGKIRIIELLRGLRRPLILLSFSDEFKVVLMNELFLVVTVRKEPAHIDLERQIDAEQPITTSDLSAAMFAGTNTSLATVLDLLGPRLDLAIFEHCYMIAAYPLLAAKNPSVPVIYSAHNVEAIHRPWMLLDHAHGSRLTDLAIDLERQALQIASMVVCCTEQDAAVFRYGGAEAIVVDNGCTDDIFPLPVEAEGVIAGFLGSEHLPNIEAARFIVDELAPQFPLVTFEIVGGAARSLGDLVPRNVIIRGHVDEELKGAVLRRWTVALNPVISGGGSSLKLPDYLAHGIATLSTPEGARGFRILERKAGHIASRASFAEALQALLDDGEKRRALVLAGMDYARNELRWMATTSAYRAAVAELARTPVARSKARAVLFLSSIFAQDNGQTPDFLSKSARGMRNWFDRVDLAAIGAIEQSDRFFSQGWWRPAQSGSSCLAEDFDWVNVFNPADSNVGDSGERTRALLRQWLKYEIDVASARRRFADKDIDQPRLIGGLYHSEHDGDRIFHWSSGYFAFALPPASTAVQLVGLSDVPKLLRVRFAKADDPNGGLEREVNINGRVNILLTVPDEMSDKTILCHIFVEEHWVSPDVRTFGLMVECFTCWIDSPRQSDPRILEEQRVSLDHSLKDLVSQNYCSPELESSQEAILTENLLSVSAPRSECLKDHLYDIQNDYELIVIDRDILINDQNLMKIASSLGSKVIIYNRKLSQHPIMDVAQRLIFPPSLQSLNEEEVLPAVKSRLSAASGA